MDKQTKEILEYIRRGYLETDAIRTIAEGLINIYENPPSGEAKPHASTHGIGGNDPVTPDMIGALPITGGSVSGFITPSFEVVEDTDEDDQVTLQNSTQCAFIITKDLNVGPFGNYTLTVNSTRILPTVPVIACYAGGERSGQPLLISCIPDNEKCAIKIVNFDQTNNLQGQLKFSLRIL
jgi:hypothetical protein